MNPLENDVKVWAQMFFDDGSVSQGKRYSAIVLYNEMGELMQIAVKFLQDNGRTEGFLLLWGAGTIFYRNYILENNLTPFSETTEPPALNSLDV
jgi:hypothetical protein